MNLDQLVRDFNYLNALRESGKVNMFGAVPYLKEAMDYDKKLATKVWNAWIDSYDGETSSLDMAKASIGKFAAA